MCHSVSTPDFNQERNSRRPHPTARKVVFFRRTRCSSKWDLDLFCPLVWHPFPCFGVAWRGAGVADRSTDSHYTSNRYEANPRKRAQKKALQRKLELCKRFRITKYLFYVIQRISFCTFLFIFFASLQLCKPQRISSYCKQNTS